MSSDLLFAFDIESTSVDVKTTTPVQLCLIGYSLSTRSSRILMNTLVKPGELISEGAQAVHGISNERVASAPDYAMVAWQCALLAREMTPAYLVGFNSQSFDEPILNRCLGAPVFPGTQHVDVLTLARRYFPTEPSHKLGDLYLKFCGKPLTGAHDASVDVLGTIELLEAMQKKIGLPLPKLAEELSEPKPWAVCAIGKHKGKLLSEIPKSWASWMLANATDMSGDLKATVDAVLKGA